MMHLKSILKLRGKRIGVALVREQGLDLEIWDGGPHPRWSAGVVCDQKSDPQSVEMVGLSKVPHWLLALPTYLCTTRYTWLPSDRPEEIADMLEFELPRIVPCSTQSWTWDYSIVDIREDGASLVLVILSPLPVVESAMERAHVLGIEPGLVTVSAVLRAAGLARTKGVKEVGPCGYVWWDYGAMDFLVMEGTRLVFLRGVRICGHGPEGLGFAEAEVGRSLAMLPKQDHWPAELPIDVGGTSPELPHLIERLRHVAGVRADQTCERITHDVVSLSDAVTGPVPPAHRLNGHAHPACANLLPKHLKEKGCRLRRRRQVLVHGLRICLVVLLMLLCLRVSMWRTTRLLQEYQQRLTEIASPAQKLQFLQGQLSMIQTQVQGSVSMLDIVGQFYEVLPQDVTIHYLNIDQNGQVVIRAQAKWLSQAFDCIDPLEQSEYLSNVRQSYAHLREIEGQVLIDFELRADLEKPTIKEAGP